MTTTRVRRARATPSPMGQRRGQLFCVLVRALHHFTRTEMFVFFSGKVPATVQVREVMGGCRLVLWNRLAKQTPRTATRVRCEMHFQHASLEAFSEYWQKISSEHDTVSGFCEKEISWRAALVREWNIAHRFPPSQPHDTQLCRFSIYSRGAIKSTAVEQTARRLIYRMIMREGLVELGKPLGSQIVAEFVFVVPTEHVIYTCFLFDGYKLFTLYIGSYRQQTVVMHKTIYQRFSGEGNNRLLVKPNYTRHKYRI